MSYHDEVKSNYIERLRLELGYCEFQAEVADRLAFGFEPEEHVADAVQSGQRGGSACWCQNAYNTGFTGVPKIDAHLQAHYDHWLQTDAIRRDYDHYAIGVPYSDVPRRPYCFVSQTQSSCSHRSCEHARYRAPDTVKRMRYWIEEHCPCEIHYPELLERIDRSGDTRPEMDNDSHIAAQWDDLQFRLHRFALDTERERKPKLRVISLDQFADVLYPVDEAEAVGAFLQAFWGSDTDPVFVSFDPAILAEHAAAEAAAALFADDVPSHPDDKTAQRWTVWNNQRNGLTTEPEPEPSWQQVAATVGEFIAA